MADMSISQYSIFGVTKPPHYEQFSAAIPRPEMSISHYEQFGATIQMPDMSISQY